MNLIKTLSLAACALALCACGKEKDYAKPPVPVSVAKLSLQKNQQDMVYSANIMPRSQVYLAFKAGGYIEKMLYVRGNVLEAGDMVKTGEVLAGLRKSDFAEKLNMARGLVAEATAMSKKAEADFRRAESLYKAESITRPEYDAARAQSEVTQAKLASANAQLSEAQIAYQDSDLKSPFDAIVLKRLKEAGDMVAPGTPVFVLADVSKVKAVFGVPSDVADQLKTGMPISVIIDSMPGRTFLGKISGISGSADVTSRVFDIEVSLDNPNRVLKAGLIASITIKQKASGKNVPAIPVSAVIKPEGGADSYAVYVAADENGKTVARLKKITPGNFVDNNIEIKSGLSQDDSVIIDGTDELADGMPVRIVEKD